jgi:hypothetical protein
MSQRYLSMDPTEELVEAPVEASNNTPEIAEVAYSYWESRGHENGHDIEDWLAAEQEVTRRHRVQSAARARHANAA